jgi:hypothetical protein
MPDTSYLFGPARARRPNVMARRHIVVSGHYYASLAGLQVLEAGGNAIDAGVATGLAIDVLESEFVGFGGVAPAMIHLAEGNATHVISGVGVWPKAASIEHFHRNFGGRIPEGLLQSVVPAAPSIWISALARFGTMSFAERGRELRAGRSRPHPAVYGGSGARPCDRRPACRSQGCTPRVLSRRHRHRDPASSAGEWRLADRERSC